MFSIALFKSVLYHLERMIWNELTEEAVGRANRDLVAK